MLLGSVRPIDVNISRWIALARILGSLCYVFEALNNFKINFQGFDYQQIGIYLALNASKNEIKELGLSKFVPTRIVKKGGKSKIQM